MFKLIALATVAATPLSPLQPLCEVYNWVDNPTCTTTFKDSAAAVNRLIRFKGAVETACHHSAPVNFNVRARTVGTTLPNAIFEQLIIAEHADFVEKYACVL